MLLRVGHLTYRLVLQLGSVHIHIKFFMYQCSRDTNLALSMFFREITIPKRMPRNPMMSCANIILNILFR
ncbi:hypothetical protein EPI10_006111 [Gossypium australe]|uniref:Uncharacterized protein n=1 Tax=Gossypium australe TaxID=47621 RepID=A0A5B6WSA8_9ROSI|nr:hypothetical protein EPI10_006111 [Gossypium australe]